MARLSRAEGEVLLDRFRRHHKDHGQPVTRPRQQIARVVLLSDEHLSVEQIRRQLLAAGASGSIGPARLAGVGPAPGPVALAVGLELLVGALLAIGVNL